MTTIPTGPEHINRRARLLTDLKHPNTHEVIYRAGEVVTVKDVRPAPSFMGGPNASVGYRRVTVQGHPTQRPRMTSANNLELITEAPRPASSGVTVTVHGGGAGGGYAAPRTMAAGGVYSVAPSSPKREEMTRERARALAREHRAVADAYETLSLALDHLREVEAR